MIIDTTAVIANLAGTHDAAQDANRRFGKGRYPAGLNFGDCMSYALTRVCDETLLFKANDIARTDIRPAGKRR